MCPAHFDEKPEGIVSETTLAPNRTNAAAPNQRRPKRTPREERRDSVVVERIWREWTRDYAIPSRKRRSIRIHSVFIYSLVGSVNCLDSCWSFGVDWSASTFKITLRGGSCTIASLADPTGLNLKPRATIFLAAFTSRSMVRPHLGQCSCRFSSGNAWCPHIEHLADVPCALT